MVVGMIPVEPEFPQSLTVTTRIWMDRNLGVDQGLDINTITSKQILDSTVVCTSGRASDGHRL
jgi:hypothetical protein